MTGLLSGYIVFIIIPAGIASVVAYCTFGLFFGWQPLFRTPSIALDSPWQLGPYFLLAIICAMMATLYTRTQQGAIGSGGSGGVFGPAMVSGGCTGGAVGSLFHQVWPGLVPHPASFVIMGMAGFFAAAAKTPFSTLIIVSEMTGDYRLFLPALWVCAWSFLLSDRLSLYRSQVESRSRSPDHQGDFVRDVLVGQYGPFRNNCNRV